VRRPQNPTKIPGWLMGGMAVLAARRFPAGYWAGAIGSWAADYRHLASAAKAGDGGASARALSEQLAGFRALAARTSVRVLVLGSRRDTTCSALKAENELTPALGGTARFETLDNEHGGHVSVGDLVNSTVYEIAGPRVGSWLADSFGLANEPKPPPKVLYARGGGARSGAQRSRPRSVQPV
jgi:hypothetical protein